MLKYSGRMRASVLGVGLCLLAGLAGAQAPLTPCRVEGIKTEVRCGVLRRALNPAEPAGVQIDIHYMVVPALARRKLPDPVFLLAGGPGQSAIDVAAGVLAQWRRLYNRRDLVFVDQRGTGKSAPLMCPDARATPLAQQLDAERGQARLRQCLTALQKLPYGDLRFFTTTLAMQDLNAVRLALGFGQINLVGVSYGTRAALEYMRQFAPNVRRSVLDGVAPPDMVLPDSLAADSQAALDALFLACSADADCATRYPNLSIKWRQMLTQLPQEVSLTDPLTGTRERVLLTRQTLLGAVRGPLYAPALAAALPEALAQATRGDFGGLMGLNALVTPRGSHRLAEGMHFSVLCAEDAPLLAQRRASPTLDPARDFGSAFAEPYEKTCSFWPRGEVPAAFYSVPASRAPVLVLSGGLDPATPPRHAARVVKALGAQARHVQVANAGHGVLALGCMADVLYRFVNAVDDQQALAINTDCAQAMPRPPAFAPVSVLPRGAA